ncbi:pyridoxamine 5'-phosphate oxidase family protein [Nannocystis pusilla]|uniref:Pyridoxamine 5'-phosphate oxidase family protein n=1 Tax=Nannocystis pusilla TaxID=889268 RepID=A0A9X3F144_9BACT|nr:pyridoxamine 5'-phosphate oxidase family protein [Nannocystis pusilla]MCY1009411.1 pyridoxamine 5'-phosphate oxidase family protein [Nannocystis pusilla]
MVEGAPGFVHSPDPRTLRIDALPGADDPASAGITVGAALGCLGIELPTRRRNRVNGRVRARDAEGLTMAVEASFGNCPQYIQTRTPVEVVREAAPAERLTGLDEAARVAITTADTFFVASYVDEDGDPARRGVDVSHRGGRPGFVRVDGEVLTIPDFAGNLFFNTLGNLLVNPRAGLVFVDFERGDLLQVSGPTELVLAGEELAQLEGRSDCGECGRSRWCAGAGRWRRAGASSNSRRGRWRPGRGGGVLSIHRECRYCAFEERLAPARGHAGRRPWRQV